MHALTARHLWQVHALKTALHMTEATHISVMNSIKRDCMWLEQEGRPPWPLVPSSGP
jgi:hypothetical protein